MNDLALFKQWLQTSNCQSAFEQWKLLAQPFNSYDNFPCTNKHYFDEERSLGEKSKRFVGEDFRNAVLRPTPPRPTDFSGGVFPQPAPEPTNIIPMPGESAKQTEDVPQKQICAFGKFNPD